MRIFKTLQLEKLNETLHVHLHSTYPILRFWYFQSSTIIVNLQMNQLTCSQIDILINHYIHLVNLR